MRFSCGVLALLLAFQLTGCASFRHEPPGPIATVGAPEVLRERTAAVLQQGMLAYTKPQVSLFSDMSATGAVGSQRARMARGGSPPEHLLQGVASWFAAPVDGAAADYQIVLSGKRIGVNRGRAFGTFLAYMATLGLVPVHSEAVIESQMVVTSGGQELFRNVDQTRLHDYFAFWGPIPFQLGRSGNAEPIAAADYLLASHRAALAQRVAQDQEGFSAVARQGKAAAYEKYLAENPLSFFRGEALRGLSAIAARSSNPLAAHKPYAARYPDYVRYIDGSDALWFVGPPGMQVMDIAPAIRRGTGAELLASQIRAARQPYKVFSKDELALLKRRGVPDAVAAAMLDVTREVGVAAVPTTAPDAGAQAARGGSLFAAMAAPAAANNAATMAPAGAAPAQPEGLGAKVAGGAAECAKAYIAKKACEKIPDPTPFGFAIKACIKQVKKTYGGAGCPLL